MHPSAAHALDAELARLRRIDCRRLESLRALRVLRAAGFVLPDGEDWFCDLWREVEEEVAARASPEQSHESE